MPLTVAVQMDPIERIRIAGDSTFALLLEAQARGHTMFYYTPDRLNLQGSRLFAQAQPLTVRDEQGEHATLGEARAIELTELDVVLLRQDPPFDLAYITTTHLLERIHPRTLVVNDPRSVRDAPEKLFVMDFPELMPPTLISRERAEIEAFRAEHGEVVMKPLYGYGGAAVFKLELRDPNFGSLFDLFSTTFREPWVIQKFLPAIVARRQAHHSGRRRAARRGQSRAGRRRHPLQHGARRRRQGDRTDPREREICAGDRPRAETARPDLRRHRRDRRLSDRNQRHLADRHSRDEPAGRDQFRGGDLGRHRGQAARLRRDSALSPAMSIAHTVRHARRARARAIPARLFNRARIEARLGKLRKESAGDDAAFRRGAVEAFREALERAAARRSARSKKAAAGGPARASSANSRTN